MICVLRIGGCDLTTGICSQLKGKPYRREVAEDGYETVYYDVADGVGRGEFMDRIRCFAEENKAAFVYGLGNPQSVKMMNFDIGITLGTALSLSLDFSKEFVAQLAQLGVSLTMSLYRADD